MLYVGRVEDALQRGAATFWDPMGFELVQKIDDRPPPLLSHETGPYHRRPFMVQPAFIRVVRSG